MLEFKILDEDDSLTLSQYDLIIAGYTGRDRSDVERHIAELAELGVPRPPEVPCFFSLESALATQAPSITVLGSRTSGEVEPVLIAAGDRLFLTVGSDHTDRDLERTDIAESKRACPKPLARVVAPVGDDFDWDAVRVCSWADDEPYQEGSIDILTPAPALFGMSGARGPAVLFGGTVPVAAPRFSFARRWSLELVLPDGRFIRHQYTVSVPPSSYQEEEQS